MPQLGARAIAAIAAVVLILVLLFSSLFTVSETDQALVLRFGQIQGDARVEEGLHFKAPFIDNVVYFEKRILPIDLPPQEVIAAGQERLVVDAFARGRIVDPVRFYQAVGTEAVAISRLTTILNSAVRRVLGRSSFEDIVRDDRDALMALIEGQVSNEARDRFGVEVIDVRLRRADLPEQNSQRVFDRMRAQRVQEATQIRARGEEAARRIRANAEREATVLVAESEREAQRVRGEGDATRNNIFAEAFSQDPDFFAFYRSMQAYENALTGEGTRMVLSPDSDFFRYFNDLSGGVAGSFNRPALRSTEQTDTAPSGTAPISAAPSGLETSDNGATVDTETETQIETDTIQIEPTIGTEAVSGATATETDAASETVTPSTTPVAVETEEEPTVIIVPTDDAGAADTGAASTGASETPDVETQTVPLTQ